MKLEDLKHLPRMNPFDPNLHNLSHIEIAELATNDVAFAAAYRSGQRTNFSRVSGYAKYRAAFLAYVLGVTQSAEKPCLIYAGQRNLNTGQWGEILLTELEEITAYHPIHMESAKEKIGMRLVSS